MSENTYELTVNEPKVHIFARGEFGKYVLSGMSFPQTNSLAIEYLENDAPAPQILEKTDIVIEIDEQFNHTLTTQTEHQAEMIFFMGGTAPLCQTIFQSFKTKMTFFIGGPTSNTKGIIQKKEHCYFVHSNSIEDYRLLISTIINMLYSPGLINVDCADIKYIFNNGTLGFVSGCCVKRKDVSNRAEFAAKETISQLRRQSLILEQAKSCLICITSGMDLGFGEFVQISEIFGDVIAEDTTMVTGCALDVDLEEILIVSAIVMM